MRFVFMGTEYTLRLTGAGAKELTSALWSAASTAQKTRGKARLASLLKSGKELKVFNITQAELATFAREAKRYGVIYAVVKARKDDPTSRVDIMVRAEDAAKINRIIERLEYGKYDATDVVIEAKRELAEKADKMQARDGGAASVPENTPQAERGELQNNADELLTQIMGGKTGEGTPIKNPTAPLTKDPHRSEDLSKSSGQDGKTTAEKTGAKEGRASTKTRADKDERERKSVKAQIAEKRMERSERSSNTARKQNEQTKHHIMQQKKRKTPKGKTEKGR